MQEFERLNKNYLLPADFKFPLNEKFNRATNDFGMTDLRKETLAALQKQEAALLAVLETVRQAIRAIQPGDAGYWIKFQTTNKDDAEGQFVKKVLSEVGTHFTSLDIYERAKKLKPGFKRTVLKRTLNLLQSSGVIQKIEEGRGRRPARYEKRFYN